MATNRQLKLALRKERNDYSHKIQHILSRLTALDVSASLLPLEQAIASRTLMKKLWELLPDEGASYSFDTIEEQTIRAREYLPATAFTQIVTLHLGWDVLGFRCTLEAAWLAWKDFHTLDTDTFNACVYPDNLDWFIVRAGHNVYPMHYTEEGYGLANKSFNP